MRPVIDGSRLKPGQIFAEFRAFHAGGRAWLVVGNHERDYPTGLLDDMQEVDWVLDDSFQGPTPVIGPNEMILQRKGTEPFDEWTSKESKAAMRSARGVLRRHGFPDGMRISVITAEDMRR